jgi:hypothetical protein
MACEVGAAALREAVFLDSILIGASLTRSSASVFARGPSGRVVSGPDQPLSAARRQQFDQLGATRLSIEPTG